MTWQRITKNSIHKQLVRVGLGPWALSWGVLERVKKRLQALYGDEVLKHVLPKEYRNGTIVIRITSPLWSREIKNQEQKILRSLRDKKIKRIRFIV